MMSLPRLGRRAVATVEFALVAPFLLAMVGGIADLGLELSDSGKLMNAVSQGAQYAYLNPTSAASAIKTMVQTSTNLSGVTATITGPNYYCVSGTTTAPTLTASTVGATCTDGTTAGYFVTITATYSYAPLMPYWSGIATTTLSQTVVARMS